MTTDTHPAILAADGLVTVVTARASEYGAGGLLPLTYQVEASGGPLPFKVTLTMEGGTGQPLCRGIAVDVTNSDQPSIRNANLRIPIGRIVKQSTPLVARESPRKPTDGKQHHVRVDDARLREAAAAWRQVRALGQSGTLTAMGRLFGVSRAQAHRLRLAALDAGYLTSDEAKTRPSDLG